MADFSRTHVAVIGAGAAGISAAIGLARLGVRVTVIEGARKPGAENWSGAVYFCENLARPEILGEELLAQTPLERRVVQRGMLVCDGTKAAGFAVRSERAFRHVHTVLRPLFDRDLAAKAQLFGAEILADTQALALLRDGPRVTGVLTDRGPLEADLVFLAEGDASQLVSREGLETITPGADGLARPAFLQGIKEVLALPAAQIEARFGLAAMEGACYEILLRNGSVNGREVPLNAGAFLYTNRESISLGLVMPLENLREFAAPHQQLMEWLKALPALQPLLRGAQSLAFGAKLIRGGGHLQRPSLVQDGLAVGGAAGGFGVDFPAPNYTGPATYCGYALTLAVREILEAGGSLGAGARAAGGGRSNDALFNQARLEQAYVQRLRESRYWKDEVHLRHWPEFVASSRVFFGAQAEATVRAADALTRPGGSLRAAIAQAASAAGEAGFSGLRAEAERAADALGARKGLAGAVLAAVPSMVANSFRPQRATLLQHDEKLIPLFWEATDSPRALPPLLAPRAARWRAGIAAAMFELYRNDATPLSQKLQMARSEVLRCCTLGDVLRLPFAAWLAARPSAIKRASNETPGAAPVGAPDYMAVVPTQRTDDKLALLDYRGEHATHIHFHAQRDAAGRPVNASSSLLHVCPAQVYVAEQDLAKNTAISVQHENCIRCESCWRAEDAHVDWGRTRAQRVEFACNSPAAAWLREDLEAAALAQALPRVFPTNAAALVVGPAHRADESAEQRATTVAKNAAALQTVARRAAAFLALVQESPSVLTGAQQARLADYALALAVALDATEFAGAASLAGPLRAHIASKRFFQAEADALLVRDVYLPRWLKRTSSAVVQRALGYPLSSRTARVAALRAQLALQFPRDELHAVDDAAVLPQALRAKLVAHLLGHIDGGASRTHELLAALSGLSPALAWMAAETILARELCAAAGHVLNQDWLVAVPEGELRIEGSGVVGRALALGSSDRFLLVCGACMALHAHPQRDGGAAPSAGERETASGALGLRAAAPTELSFTASTEQFVLSGARTSLRREQLVAVVAEGIAQLLLQRATEHAQSRVQFPGLFRDLRGRDGIAKFGAVRELLGGAAAATEVLTALATASAATQAPPSEVAAQSTGLLAVGAALELLGPGPRSVSYLAGQVLGGTAYSEEDDVCRFFRDAAAFGRVALDLRSRRHARAEYALREGLAAPLRTCASSSSPRLSAEFQTCMAVLTALDTTLAQGSATTRAALQHDVARLAGLVDAAVALQQRVDALHDEGASGAMAHTALTILMQRVQRRAKLLTQRCSDAEDLVHLGRHALQDGLDTPVQAWRGATYAQWLASDATHQSGDLLLAAREPMTPERAAADTALAERVVDNDIWRARCGAQWQRGVERAHQLSLDDLALLRDRGAFRMVVPEAEGGLGLSKLAYYRSCARMARYGDIAQPVVVMGSMSIGCLPLLIGLKEDLPRLQAALDNWLAKREALEKLAERCEAPEAELEPIIEAIAQLMPRERLLRGVLGPLEKELSAVPLTKSQPKGTVGKALRAALLAAETERSSIEHRAAAHKSYLALIAAGRISAFALTEPSAGSDTARVRTKATSASVAVQSDPRGFWTFMPEGGTARRNLFARDALHCTPDGISWRRPDGSELLVQWIDRGAPGGPERSVLIDGVRVPMHDLGRVASVDGKDVWRHWIVNGSKMWITNASIAGVMILYARTSAGITAFALDAHAEGLSVGRDEHKMGQRGSTTNELTLSDVRVCADQLIGLDGRGQENALETLNVGRAGLSFVALAEMQGLLDEVRATCATDPAILREVGRMALDLLVSESVAHAVTGCFDHKHTKGIRMDSAAAKTLATEALMRCITRAEALLPRASVLEGHLFEKRRRDARVLSIYEGTNEIQRFLLMRDVFDPTLQQRIEARGHEANLAAGSTERALSAAFADFSKHAAVVQPVAAAIAADAVLQPIGFQLADAFVRLSGAAVMVGRADALRTAGCGAPEWQVLLDSAAMLAAQDAARRGALSLQCAQADRAALAEGAEPLLVALGDDALLAQGAAHGGSSVATEEFVASAIVQPQTPPSVARIAVLLDPAPELLARQWANGAEVFDGAFELSAADRHVLNQALALATSCGATVAVFAAGSPLGIPVLREALALGADSALLMEERGGSVLGGSMAAAFAEVLTLAEDLAEQPFDMILASDNLASAALPLARRMNRSVAMGATRVSVAQGRFCLSNTEGVAGDSFSGPAFVLLAGECAPQDARFSVQGWQRARELPVTVIPAPRPGVLASVRAAASVSAQLLGASADAASLLPSNKAVGAAATSGAQPMTAAAKRCLELAEVGAVEQASIDVAVANAACVTLQQATVLALVQCDATGEPAADAAAAVSAVCNIAPRFTVLAIVPSDDAAARAKAAQALAQLGAADIALVAWPAWAAADLQTRSDALRALLCEVTAPVVAAASLRCEMLLAGPAGEGLLIDRIDTLRVAGDAVALAGPRHGGRTRMEVSAPLADLRAVVTARLAESHAPQAAASVRAQHLHDAPWPVHTDHMGAAVARAAAALGSALTQAEFIIDVGFGVGGREGLELVVEPLQRALTDLGVRGVAIGATRKVTMDLGILPASAQIGQTGVSVDPKVIIALGVSGAPQHMGWIGERSVIFAFNKDAEAPLLCWNATHAKPLVIPIHGDLFREVPRFIAALQAAAASTHHQR